MQLRFGNRVCLIAIILLIGCQSKQEKAKNVEAEYDRLNAQYRADCLGMAGSDAQSVNDALMGSSSKHTVPTMTPAQQAKCKEEKTRLDSLADQLLKAQQP